MEAPTSTRGPPVTFLAVRDFRQFEQLSLNHLTWANIIVGVNGSGKTSVLWAIAIALRCFNLRFHDSKWVKQPYVEIQGKDLSKLINAPHLQSASWKYISRQGASAPTAIDSIINERSISLAIKGNGIINFNEKTSGPEGHSKMKIPFAFVAAESTFLWPSDEPDPGATLTSAAGGMRKRFGKLAKAKYGSTHDEVIAHMKQLFGIHGLRYEGKSNHMVYVTEAEGDNEVEIMYTGEGLRKVFSALVLFYTLVGVKAFEGRCVYLVEEPEAHLHPTLQQLFAILLLNLARQHKVQLFITTNLEHIFSSVPVCTLLIPKENFTVLTCLDQNRAKGFLAKKIHISPGQIQQVVLILAWCFWW